MSEIAKALVSRIRAYENNKASDRFNLFTKEWEQIPYPKITKKNLEELIFEAVLRIENPTIAWSGGVDSTTIVCAYIQSNKPFEIICTPQALEDCKLFYEYLVKRKTKINIVKDFTCFKGENIWTGNCSDMLFYPKYQRFRQWADCVAGRDSCIIPEIYIEIVKDKADKAFGLILKDEYDLFNFVLKYFSYSCCMYDINIASKNTKIYSFYDTEEFNDYGYTHFYDKKSLNKNELRKIICDTTLDDSYMSTETLFTKGYSTYNLREIPISEVLDIIYNVGLYQGRYKYIGNLC